MDQTAPEVTKAARRFIASGRVDKSVDPVALAEACDRYISEQARSSLPKAQTLARKYERRADQSNLALQLSASRVLARISHLNARHAEAETAYLRARNLARGQKVIRARIDRALVDVYMYLGDFKESHRRAAMALRAFAGIGSEADIAMTRVNRANVLHRQDRHREAERLYREAAAFFEQQGNELAVARCYYNRANTLLQLFDMDEAERLYSASYRLYQSHERLIDATDARYGLAWLYMLQGRFHIALAELAACEETYRTAGQQRGAALCELDRAEVYLGLNLLIDARESAVAAEKQFRKLKLRYELSKAAFFRAQAAAALGRAREARTALDRAQKGFVAEHNTGFTGATHLLASRLAAQPRDARSRLRAARTCFRSAQLPLWQAFCDLYAASLHPSDPRPQRDLAENKATQVVPHLFAQWQTLLGDLAAADGRDIISRGHWRRAANRLDAVRAQLPPIELRTSFGRNLDSPHLRLIDAEIARHPQRSAAWVERYKTAGVWAPLTADDAEPDDRRRVEQSLAALAARIAALSLHISSPGERGLFAAASPALGRLQRQVRQELAHLERGHAAEVDHINAISRSVAALSAEHPVVQFHLTATDLVAFVHEGGQVRMKRWPGGRARVETFARRLRFHLEKQLIAAFRDDRSSFDGEDRFFAALGDWLWSPLEVAADNRRILVIPDGELANLPWPAIRSGNRPLVEQHQFLLAPSIRHHLRAQSVRTRDSRMEVFIGQADDLPEVGRELDVLFAAGNNLTVHNPATRDAWPRSGEAHCWHFAGHAVFRADNPFYSYLSMADGPMFAADFRPRRVQVGLVTLAACRSGEQVPMPGEESTGLVRSLLEMGARNVIAGHWPVADHSTARWMASFYDQYLRGASIHGAMRSAACTVREQYRSAYHWAAFSLFGAGN